MDIPDSLEFRRAYPRKDRTSRFRKTPFFACLLGLLVYATRGPFLEGGEECAETTGSQALMFSYISPSNWFLWTTPCGGSGRWWTERSPGCDSRCSRSGRCRKSLPARRALRGFIPRRVVPRFHLRSCCGRFCCRCSTRCDRADAHGASGLQPALSVVRGPELGRPRWDATVFTKNRERLLCGDIAQAFFESSCAASGPGRRHSRFSPKTAIAQAHFTDEHFTGGRQWGQILTLHFTTGCCPVEETVAVHTGGWM